MDGKRVSALCRSINTASIQGPDPKVTGISYDSRRTKKNDLYFALPGVHTDGHRFINHAVERGAAAIVCSKLPKQMQPTVCFIQVENPRTALSPVSAAFYKYPSRELKVIGVTGTDGKSTTVFFIHQLLEYLRVPSGFLSTVHYQEDIEVIPNPFRQSTPEAPEIHSILRSMKNHRKEVVVLEATSHGLSPLNNRLGDVEFDSAVFTNLSHEHLEFHKSFEQYREDKTNLFKMLERAERTDRTPFGIVNLDDKNGRYFSEASDAPTYTYSLFSSEADLRAEEILPTENGSRLLLARGDEKLETEINLPGKFHVEDLLAALLTVAEFTGKNLSDFQEAVPALSPVPGRMEAVASGQPFSVLVDYAHTPGSFEKLLPSVREQTSGKLIALFGSAGERDVEKRGLQGETASRYSDIIVLADEDPRGEERTAILLDIAQGCAGKKEGENLYLIPDRREAIQKAFSLARPGDTVLLLGKGHETSIIYESGAVPWNEYDEARAVLAKMGYTAPDEF